MRHRKYCLSCSGLSSQEDTKDLRPNSESFSIIIRAWLTVASKGSDQALRSAVRWLDILVQREKAETGVVSAAPHLYTNILGVARTCASHSPGVLDLAIDVFEKLRGSHHMMECIDYTRLLQVVLLALSRPMNDKQRKYLVTKIIKEAQEYGFVDTPLLQALANGPVYSDGWTAKASQVTAVGALPSSAQPSLNGPNPFAADGVSAFRGVGGRSNSHCVTYDPVRSQLPPARMATPPAQSNHTNFCMLGAPQQQQAVR